jgi:hypothetical protein
MSAADDSDIVFFAHNLKIILDGRRDIKQFAVNEKKISRE